MRYQGPVGPDDVRGERAVRLAGRRGATAKTARWLAARGFAQESVESALAGIAEDEGRELG